VTTGTLYTRYRALLLSVLLGTCVANAASAPLKAGVFSPPRQAPDFSLQGSHGKTFKLSDYRGKVVVIGFGYTSCPSVCPTTLAVLAQAHRQLGEAARDVQIIYVTVDPEVDDAQRLKQYLGTFNATFVGGTDSEERLAAVRQQYGVLVESKDHAGSYSLSHSSSLYLIDRHGRLRAMMPYGHSPSDYVHDLRILLQEPAGGAASNGR
jgi:protein SCO1